MNYVIQNYFFPVKSLYTSPKITFLLFLKSFNLIIYFFKNNVFLKTKLLLIFPLWYDFKLLKKFFLLKNILFFYNNFLKLKFKFFNFFLESCFFLNLHQLNLFLNHNRNTFPYHKNSLKVFHHNLYFSHFQIATFNFKKNFYYKFIFYLFVNNYFMWSYIFNCFDNKNFFLLANDYFLLNYYFNTYFFNVFNY